MTKQKLNLILLIIIFELLLILSGCKNVSKIGNMKKLLFITSMIIISVVSACSQEVTLLESKQYSTVNDSNSSNPYESKLNEIDSTSPFIDLYIIEEIRFIQDNNMEIIAALVRHENANQYSIEVFIPNSNTFQTLPIIYYTNRPSNLQATTALSDGNTTSLALITLNNVNTSNETGFNYSFDTVFSWNSINQSFTTVAQRSSTTRFSNVNGTEFYATTLIINENLDYKIIIYNGDFSSIQSFTFEREDDYWSGWPVRLDFRDLTNDGYGDLWKFTYVLELGARNLIYAGFIWDIALQKFIQVEFEGFDWLMQPYYGLDGYIINHIRNYATGKSIIQNMMWEGNRLILISEEYIRE